MCFDSLLEFKHDTSCSSPIGRQMNQLIGGMYETTVRLTYQCVDRPTMTEVNEFNIGYMDLYNIGYITQVHTM